MKHKHFDGEPDNSGVWLLAANQQVKERAHCEKMQVMSKSDFFFFSQGKVPEKERKKEMEDWEGNLLSPVFTELGTNICSIQQILIE